ncbi:MAG TPA: hypothetical protein VGE40_09015 [Bacilli bacterium]
MTEDKTKSHVSQVWGGMGIGTLLNILLALLLLLIYREILVGIGLAQLIVILPAVLYWRKNTGMVQGLLIAAGLTFLLNAACFGLVMYSIS